MHSGNDAVIRRSYVLYAFSMSPTQCGNVNFLCILDDLVEVTSGQIGRSNSLWLYSYRPFAEFVVSNFPSNGAFGQISAVESFHHLLPVIRGGFLT